MPEQHQKAETRTPEELCGREMPFTALQEILPASPADFFGGEGQTLPKSFEINLSPNI